MAASWKETTHHPEVGHHQSARKRMGTTSFTAYTPVLRNAVLFAASLKAKQLVLALRGGGWHTKRGQGYGEIHHRPGTRAFHLQAEEEHQSMTAPSRADLYASRYPLLVLQSSVLLPGHAVTLALRRKDSIEVIKRACQQQSALLVVVYNERQAQNNFDQRIGTLARIADTAPQDDERLSVRLEGLRRVRLHSIDQRNGVPQARIELLLPTANTHETALLQRVRKLASDLHRLLGVPDAETLQTLQSLEDPDRFADLLAAQLVRDLPFRQRLLELVNPAERLEQLIALMQRELSRVLQAPPATASLPSPSPSTILPEEVPGTSDELRSAAEEAERLRRRLAESGAPPFVQERLEQEIERLAHMSPASAEASIARTYIETTLSIPWANETPDILDLDHARAILDRDHFGLETVKERLLDYLAVRALTRGQGPSGTVLCLVGPPGVGKTSLARSIAEALGRRFVTVSLGGVRDEAEIRGHRRTYLGAYPGRIIEALRRARTRNPVLLLDELDKLTTDYRGDPAAALLEVLDPEQNRHFLDHYVDMPVDLSLVLFLATANSLAPVPRPLRDRLEVITLEGYNAEEKREIGRRHLLPRQLRAHGLPERALELTDAAWHELITGYTREAGVRELERQLAALCRKAARKIVERQQGNSEVRLRQRITPATLRRYLGPPLYQELAAHPEPQVGVAYSLAATPLGGMLVPVEVLVMPGRGELVVTGQAGEVLQESARAALSWVRAHAVQLGLPPDFAKHTDLHIHLPEGALPKDGPSAGLTLVVALVSALTNRPVRSDVALTGEITLRGRVLPVGDLRLKVLAAQRAGLRSLIAPAANHAERVRLPSSVMRQLTFHWVETVDQALALAFCEEKGPDNHPERANGKDSNHGGAC